MTASSANGYNETNNMVQIEETIYQELVENKERVPLLEHKIRLLEEGLRRAGVRMFGRSSEKFTPEQYRLLFNEIEENLDPQAPEPAVETLTYTRKRGGQRKLDLDLLTTEEVRYSLPEEEQICPQCDGHLHKMGEEVREELKIVPAQHVRVRHIRDKYACRHCQNHALKTPVVTAPMPEPAFPGSLASPSLVAHTLYLKFVLGIPLYRQEQDLRRKGLDISRQNLSNWALRGADLLSPLYDRIAVHLRRRDILHADETVLQVLHESGRKAEQQSYMWLYRSGRDGPPLILYEYQPTRESKHPQTFLCGYPGYLHVDGYEAYEALPGASLVGCWSHARRKFKEALDGLPPDERKQGNTRTHQAMKFCRDLFKIERDLHDVTPAERKVAREQRSKPLLDKMHACLLAGKEELAPKSHAGKAFSYCVNQWSKLTRFLEDGRLEIDNNRAERSVKPFVIGRKNWLFSNTAKGARSSAILYSIVETAKENNLDPFRYLTYLFEQLPGISKQNVSALDRLLPIEPEIQAKFGVQMKSAPPKTSKQ